MHKYLFLFGLCLGASALAQPKWSKKTRKSLVEVVTLDKGGLVLQRRAGFVTTEDGNVMTTYSFLPGAASVEVKASDGKTYRAERVVAADAMMDFCVFSTNIKKPVAIADNVTASLKEGDAAYILTADDCKADTITRIEEVKGNPYYSLAPAEDGAAAMAGSPMLDAGGALLGMVHAADEKGTYAVAMSTVRDSKPTAMTAVGRTYADLPVPVMLPANEDDARTLVFLSQKADSARYMAHIDDFIAAFPAASFGYTTKGEYLIQKGDTAAASATYEQGMKTVEAGDELLYSHSLALYRAGGSMDEALALCEQAIDRKTLPLYQNHRAMVMYALKRYSEAAEGFEAVAQTNMRGPQTFIYASQSRRMAGDSIGVCLALLDSAVACYTKPYPAEAATTLLLRATTRAEAALWRPAVMDYNEYEHLCAGNVSAEFYYRRFIAEANGRMYQQAIDDLDRAITLSPNDAELHAQKALLLYRLGHGDEALPEARRAIEIDPEWKEELKNVIQQ